MPEIKFPVGGMVLRENEDGSTTIAPKDVRRDEKLQKQKKENEEIRNILFKSAEEDVGHKYFLYVYKLVDIAGNRTLVMTIPLDQLDNVDVERYVKDRVFGEEGGTTYLCYVKDQAGQLPPNKDVRDICLRFVFEEDGDLYLKEKEKKEQLKFNKNIGGFGMVRENPNQSPGEMLNAIKDAVNVGIEAGKPKESTDNNRIVDLVGTLAKAVADKPLPPVPPPQENSMVQLLTVLTPILAPFVAKLAEPKPVDNSSLEILKEITMSLRDVGKSIAETNLKIAEEKNKTMEKQYQDKMEMMAIIEKAVNQKDTSGGSVMQHMMTQMVQSMEMSKKIQDMSMMTMMGMVKNVIELQSSLKGNEETVTKPLWQPIVEKLLDPESWAMGYKMYQTNKNPQLVNQEHADNQSVNESTNTDNNDNLSEEIMGNDNEFINTVFEEVLKDIKTGSKPELIVDSVLEGYSDRKEDIKVILNMVDKDIGSCMRLLKPTLLASAMKNSKMLQQILDGLKSKLFVIPL